MRFRPSPPGRSRGQNRVSVALRYMDARRCDRPGSSPVWRDRCRELPDGGQGLGRAGAHLGQHDQPDREQAALVRPARRAPRRRRERLFGEQQPHEKMSRMANEPKPDGVGHALPGRRERRRVGWHRRPRPRPRRGQARAVPHIPEQPVPPGAYRVRGLYRKPLDLRYEFSIYNPGSPAWSTADTGASASPGACPRRNAGCCSTT